jgi:hypothetical protein
MGDEQIVLGLVGIENPSLWLNPKPRANPTIVSYNDSAINIHNAMNSLVRFQNKNVFFCFEKCSSLL